MNEPDLKFLDFSKNQSYAIPDGKIALYMDDKNVRRITLDNSITELVRDGYYSYLRVGYNEFASDMYFIFCKNPTPDALVITSGKKNRIVINSKFLVEQIIERMGLPRKSQHLNVSENLSKSPDYITFRITKA